MTDRYAPATPRDEVLLSQWCGGDIAAGNELIKRYLRPLRLYFGSKLSSEHDVQDLAQTTLATCAELAQRSGGRLEGVASFRAYLFGIARNKLLHFYSRKLAVAGVDDVASMPVADLSPGPSTLVKMQQRVDTLLLAMNELSIDQQTAIQLKYWSGMTQQEVADALGVPEGTVARRIHEAKHKLLAAYAKLGSRQASSRGELADDDELRDVLAAMARRLL
jgi:RNA polymerase sigma factor (sigma-70 family)